MIKRISIVTLALAMTTALYAQDLDTANVADQFTAGSRSDQANDSTWAPPTYPEITGSFNYFTTYEAGTATETPVLDVTIAQTVTDIGSAIPAISSNNADTSSTSPNMSIYVGDGGGGQNLQFGQLTNKNYYVATAFWCETRDSGLGWERTYLTVRCPLKDTVSNVDAVGGYGIVFESDHGKLQAVKWNPNYATNGDLTVAAVTARDDNARILIAETAAISSPGWHTAKIAAGGSQITFGSTGCRSPRSTTRHSLKAPRACPTGRSCLTITTSTRAGLTTCSRVRHRYRRQLLRTGKCSNSAAFFTVVRPVATAGRFFCPCEERANDVGVD